jgi:hypothetical protein
MMNGGDMYFNFDPTRARAVVRVRNMRLYSVVHRTRTVYLALLKLSSPLRYLPKSPMMGNRFDMMMGVNVWVRWRACDEFPIADAPLVPSFRQRQGHAETSSGGL